MYKIILLLAVLATGCASPCQDALKVIDVPPTIPNQMGIMIDGKDIQADENGGKFLADYIYTRAKIATIKAECEK